MNRRYGSRGRPPWWPHNEPWPPRGPAPHWRAGRARFFRAAAALALLGLLLSASGGVALSWLVAAWLGVPAPARLRTATILAVGAMAGVGIALFGLLRIVRRVALPLGGVIDAAERVAAGTYEVRVAEQGPPPIRALARAFNAMTERLGNHDRLRRDLMADVAHELRTPLTVMQGKLEGLLDGVYPRDDGQLQQLLEETHVLSRLVEDLRTLALSESGALKLQKEPTDLGGLARDAVIAFNGDATTRHVTLEVEAPHDLPLIEIDPVRVREVITNLLSNALRHTPAGGSVAVRVAAAPNDALSVEVRDTGIGMTPDAIARAFDRFYKGSGSRGSGLGLSIARSLVAAHGGEIHASSEPGHGAAIAFTLPRGG